MCCNVSAAAEVVVGDTKKLQQTRSSGGNRQVDPTKCMPGNSFSDGSNETGKLAVVPNLCLLEGYQKHFGFTFQFFPPLVLLSATLYV